MLRGINIQTNFAGMIMAPNAEVVVGQSGKNFYGAIYAKAIVVHQNANFAWGGGRPQARTTIAKAFRPYSDYVMDFLRGEIVRKICSFLSLEVCVRFDSANVWLAYECNVIGKNYRKVLDSLTLNMAVFLGIEVIRTESGGVLYSGNYYNMILEQDTVSYASDSLKEYFTNYSSPDGWQRMGCFGNLCVAKLHMYNNEEFCYDK